MWGGVLELEMGVEVSLVWATGAAASQGDSH